MLLSKTTILGLLACLATQATSRPLEVDAHPLTVNSSSLEIDSNLVKVDPRAVEIASRAEPIDPNALPTPKVPTLWCTYSYNALYDWYVIEGEGWYPNDEVAYEKLKDSAKGAGLMTGWSVRYTNDEDGRIVAEVSIRHSYMSCMTDSGCVQFRLPLGRRSSLLKRLGTNMFPPHGKRVGCSKVSRRSQNLLVDPHT